MITILLRHLDLYQRESTKPFQILKKFFKIYINGWPGAADLRAHLMDATSPGEVRAIIAATTIPTTVTP